MPEYDLILRGAQIPGKEGIKKADLAVSHGTIAAVAKKIDGQGARELKLSKCLLAPAFLDAHVHFNEPGRESWEGIATGSRAVALGGGSWFADMPLNSDPPVLDAARLKEKHDLMMQKSHTDFSLWGGLSPGNIDELEGLRDAGAIGLKAFMCPSGIDGFPHVTPPQLKAGMEKAAQLGLLVAVHAETPGLGELDPPPDGHDARAFLTSRPVGMEVRATLIACELAGETGCRLHIVHASCPEAVGIAQEAREAGADISVETCPHYLLFDESRVVEDGAPFKCAPPLRRPFAVGAMWDALADDEIDTIGSDHSPAPPEMKADDDFFKIWGGIAGCQHGISALLGAANMRAAGLPGILQKTSANVARRFRLENKGTLEPGMDADLVAIEFDPDAPPITETDLVYRHPYSAYIGLHPNCHVRATFCRGHPIGGEERGDFQPRFLRPSENPTPATPAAPAAPTAEPEEE